jgi:hypothetical protein
MFSDIELPAVVKVMRMPAVVAVVVDDAAGKRGEDRQQGDYTKDLAFHLFSPGAVSA